METEESLPLPNERMNFLGSADLERHLSLLISEEAIAGGWIIHGPEGIGKTTFAYRLARSILARPDDRLAGLAVQKQSVGSRLIAVNAHPDLRIAARAEKKSGRGLSSDIIIDAIHGEVTGLLQRTPAMGDWRVVIVDEADAMNANAANALLKILEEPPARSVLLLTASAPALMPATIRSRCRRIRLGPRPMAEIELFLEGERQLDPGQVTSIAQAARGRPGRAARLSSKSGANAARAVHEFLELAPDGARLRASRALSIAQHDEAWEFFVELLRERLAENVFEGATTAGLQADLVRSRISAFRETERLMRVGLDLNLERAQVLLGVARTIARHQSGSAVRCA